MSLRDFKTVKERREFLSKKTGAVFSAVSLFPPGLEKAGLTNCENMIGAASIPLGVAGPLLLRGMYAEGEYYLPLATTEAALVASVNRGSKALSAAGGAVTAVERVGITRGSVYKTGGLRESREFTKWLKDNFAVLAAIAGEVSGHLSLKKIETKIAGLNVFVRFSFDSSDAMGMNLCTFASDQIAAFIRKEKKIDCLALAGNYDVDKKAAWLNFILGRGREVWAEAFLGRDEIKNILKTTPEKIHEVALRKCLVGSAVSGSMGFNAHFANVIAALYLSCGQDPAHIVEGSLGITTTEIIDGKLHLAVNLPCLVVGTIGGGTALPSQLEALKLLGVDGGDRGSKADAFAEIVGGAVLAGELSLLASLSVGGLASSHRKLSGHKST